LPENPFFAKLLCRRVSGAAGVVASASLWLAFIGSVTPSVKFADLSNAGGIQLILRRVHHQPAIAIAPHGKQRRYGPSFKNGPSFAWRDPWISSGCGINHGHPVQWSLRDLVPACLEKIAPRRDGRACCVDGSPMSFRKTFGTSTAVKGFCLRATNGTVKCQTNNQKTTQRSQKESGNWKLARREKPIGESKAAEGATTGAGGLLAELGMLTIPGIGPVVAAPCTVPRAGIALMKRVRR
jgi:hypothetical protein